MKWLKIILLGALLAAVCTAPALAVDLRVSGEYQAGGLYMDKTTFMKDAVADGTAAAFYFQRLRLNSTLTVSPGLLLITRADIMKRVWGGTRSTAGTTLDTASAATRAENENIAFDWAYIHFVSPVGAFRVGYMNDNLWGTVFADSAGPKGKIAWSYEKGPWYVTAQIVKMGDNSYSTATTGTKAADVDNDKYCAALKYTWKGGETGLLGGVGRDATNRPASHYSALFYTLIPYAIVQLGPVKIQAEADYFQGKWKDYETTQQDIKWESLAAWIDAQASFGMFYAGGSIAYVSGDDPGTTDKIEANNLLINGGRDWNPCLIMFNTDLTYWAGNQTGYNSSMVALNPYGYNGGPMTNAWFFQGRAGLRPLDKLDITASVSYATADKKPTAAWLHNDYGYEVDVTATYRITPNLSYMLGGGYLFTGNYFKGTAESNTINNNYLLLSKLTLTF